MKKKHNNKAVAEEVTTEAVAELSEKEAKKASKKAHKAAKKALKAAKKKRLRTKKLRTVIKGVISGSVLGVVANIVLGFVTKGVYNVAPESAVEFTKDLALKYATSGNVDVAKVIDLAVNGLAIGLVAGLALAIVLVIGRAIANKKRFKNVSPIREALDAARHIRCESYTKIKALPKGADKVKKSHKKGNLFLTDCSIEFYNKKFRKAKKNFLIKLSDVSYVKRRGNKLHIYTGEGKYTFKVQAGTAKRWKKAILRAAKANKK